MWNKEFFRLKALFYSTTLIILMMLSASCRKNQEADTRKLEELKQAYIWNARTEKGRTYLDKLKEEALKSGNDKYMGTAYYYLADYYQAKNQSQDSILYLFGEAKKYYQKARYERGIVLAETAKVNVLVVDNGNELALEIITALLKDVLRGDDDYMKGNVYATLGHIYVYSDRPEDALTVYHESLLAYNRTPYQEDMGTIPEYNSVINMQAMAANMAKKYEQSLSYCDSYIANLGKEISSQKYKDERLSEVIIVKANNLLDLNRVDEAKLLIKQATSLLDENPNLKLTPEISFGYKFLLSKYYQKTSQYDKGIEHLDSLSSIDLPYINYVAAQELRSEILFAKGDYKNAFAVQNELIQYTDSIKSTSTSKQLTRLRDTLKMEMMEKENDLRVKNTRIIILFLSVVCVLLILFLWIKIRNTKKIKKKNELIFSQYRDLDKYIDKVDRSNLVSETLEADEIEQPLFEKLKLHLSTTELFRNPDISRESLALELGTNRQYLTETIQDNTGMTFMEYINEMRLEYARRLLSYNIDLNIDEVYITSGFNSKSTFYRLFKQKYDLTPKEMREIAIQK